MSLVSFSVTLQSGEALTLPKDASGRLSLKVGVSSSGAKGSAPTARPSSERAW